MTEAEKLTGISNQQVSKWRRRLKDPEKYRAALFGVAYQKRVSQATQNTTGDVLPPHRPSKKVANLATSQIERANANGVSPYTQRKLDRLARDYPELHVRVSSGELSVNVAAKAAGIVKDQTPLEQLRKAWGKASEAEQVQYYLGKKYNLEKRQDLGQNLGIKMAPRNHLRG